MMLRARIKPRFRAAYDHLMEQLKVPVLTYLLEGEPKDIRKIPIVLEVLTGLAAHLIVGCAAGRKEQEELIQMFRDALEEAVANVRGQEVMEETKP